MRGWRVFRVGIKLLVVIAIVLVAGITYAIFTPPVELSTNANITFLDDNDQIFAMGSEGNSWIPLAEISETVINATLSIEDRNFYRHAGFDVPRIVQAGISNIRNRNRGQGASTITQQLARNQFLTLDKTWDRKIREAWLTVEIETHYTKDQILEAYLNTISYGNGLHGIRDAAKFYFDKETKDLTLAEAAILAGIPQAPSRYDLVRNLEGARRRQATVLRAMLNNNKITQAEFDQAIVEEITVVAKNDRTNDSRTVGYFQNAVVAELLDRRIVSRNTINKGGLRVYTTLNEQTQMAMEEAIEENLGNPELQVSKVALSPGSGAIKGLVGGRDYRASQYNRAIRSNRQIGSTIKPFLYYAALESGFTPTTDFISQPTTFVFDNNRTYTPQNFDERYPGGPINLASALALSDNIYAVKTHMFLGNEVLVSTLNRMGITNNAKPLPSLALGTIAISPLELASGFNTLASEGIKTTPHTIRKVVDGNGKTIYEHKDDRRLVLNRDYTFILNDMMSHCASPRMIGHVAPTCLSIQNQITNRYAMKTGTTSSDSWMVGYNPDIVMITWVGFDDNREMGRNDTRYTRNIWADAIEGALYGVEAAWYEAPANVQGKLINPNTGNPARQGDRASKVFYFKRGTSPRARENLEQMIKTTDNVDKRT